jgi:hypothetical protein
MAKANRTLAPILYIVVELAVAIGLVVMCAILMRGI